MNNVACRDKTEISACESSKTMYDDDWRRGAAPAPTRGRGMERGGPPRDMPFERAPQRERNESPSSSDDRGDNWRWETRPVLPPVPVAAPMERGGERLETLRLNLAPRGRRDEPEAPSREDYG
ncbi:hypothetical protein PENTCL1PPCAC_23879, partial [Pristionchus entomophagus]